MYGGFKSVNEVKYPWWTFVFSITLDFLIVGGQNTVPRFRKSMKRQGSFVRKKRDHFPTNLLSQIRSDCHMDSFFVRTRGEHLGTLNRLSVRKGNTPLFARSLAALIVWLYQFPMHSHSLLWLTRNPLEQARVPAILPELWSVAREGGRDEFVISWVTGALFCSSSPLGEKMEENGGSSVVLVRGWAVWGDWTN